MRLIIVSGLSGAGKSIALHMLEDLDYYCVDNIPAALLKPFVSHTLRSRENLYRRTGVGIDARNTATEIATVPDLVRELKSSGIECELIFLTASDEELLRRFAETRRKHPLSRGSEGLHEAIRLERALLEPIAQAADLILDTSHKGTHDLRETMRHRVDQRQRPRMSILFESFGYRTGSPGTPTSCLTPARSPTRIGSSTCARSPAVIRPSSSSLRATRGCRDCSRTSRASSRPASPSSPRPTVAT